MIQHSIHLEKDLKVDLHYTCPECGRSVTLKRQVIFEVGDVDTQQKKAIDSLSLFDYKCEYCGHRFNALHNFTVIRNSREEDVNFILHFMSDRDLDKADRLFRNHLIELYFDNDMLIEIDKFGNFINAGYPCRIVRGRVEFDEKRYIFEDKLDDRVIEVMKLMAKDQFLREHPNVKDIMLFYSNKNSVEITWRVLAGQEFTTYSSPISQYRLAAQVVTYSIKYWNSNQMFIIDELFAQTVMSIYSKHKNDVPASYAEIKIKTSIVREADERRAMIQRETQRRMQMRQAGYQQQQNLNGYSSGSHDYTYNNQDSSNDSSSSYSSYGSSETQNPGFEFKYDQTRAMNEGGSSGYESYVTQNETYYGNSEYRPFMSDGSTVEMYHMDDGSVSMDN